MQANLFQVGENVGVINSDVLNFGSLAQIMQQRWRILKIVIFSGVISTWKSGEFTAAKYTFFFFVDSDFLLRKFVLRVVMQ